MCIEQNYCWQRFLTALGEVLTKEENVFFFKSGAVNSKLALTNYNLKN